MRSSALSILFLAASMPCTRAQSEWTKPENYTYEEPVIFDQWCEELTEMYGPSCTCKTDYGISNNIFSVDLDHEIKCDPLQGYTTCIEGITIESARVYLKATSIGYEGDFERIRETAIRDFYVFLDDTDVGTISFRFNDNINQRRTGCEAVYGAINCPLCGICGAAPHNKSADVPNHLGPADIFQGISGQCRYGNGDKKVGLFDTCEDGGNILTKIFWRDLEVTSVNETTACPKNDTEGGDVSAPQTEGASSSGRTTTMDVVSIVGLALASAVALWV